MKGTQLIAAAFAALLVMVSCNKNEPTPAKKDTTPAELKSFQILASDNEGLEADIVPAAITEDMVLRVKGGGSGKTFTATLTAGENDVIKLGETEVGEDGKASFDATFPVDILVTNTKSKLTASYVVKIGKVLEIVGTPGQTYTETNSSIGLQLVAATNPLDGKVYFAYDRTLGEEKNANISIAKYEETALSVYASGIADNSSRKPILSSFSFGPDGTPYILHYSEKTANIMGVKYYNGTAWVPLGDQEIGHKISVSYGYPEFAFENGKMHFLTTGSDKTDVASYKNAYIWSWDGEAWSSKGGLSGIPAYGTLPEISATAGTFYKGAALSTEDAAYYAISANQVGYYLYKVQKGQYTKLVDNFKPAGEEYGVPSNLCVNKGVDGRIYVFAAHSTQSQMQIYRYNESAGTLEPYADPLQFTAGAYGAIKEPASLLILPEGQMVVVKQGTQYPSFNVLDENRQWSGWNEITTPNPAYYEYTRFAAAVTSEGVIVGAFQSKDADKVGHLETYTIALEPDILPE